MGTSTRRRSSGETSAWKWSSGWTINGSTLPATAEPATAEPAQRGPIVQELNMTLDNPTDRAIFKLETLPTDRRTAIIQKDRLLSAATIATDGFTMHILGQWKQNGNSSSHQRWRNHIVKAVVVRWAIGNANRTLMRASIRAIEGGATHCSRSRTGNSDRGDLLKKVFVSDNKHYHDTRHDEPGIARAPRTRGRWRLPRWQLHRARCVASAAHTSV